MMAWCGGVSRHIALLLLVFLVVLDDFLNDELQESACEFGVQIGITCQFFQTGNLARFTIRVRGGQIMLRFQAPHGLRVLEPLAQRIDEYGIQPVDAGAMLVQDGGGAGGGCLGPARSSCLG